MSDLARTDELFYTRAGLDRAKLERQVDDALNGADDGEMFLEYRQSESLSYDDGRLKSAAFDTSQGFGLRAVSRRGRGLCARHRSCRETRSAARAPRSRRCTRAKAARSPVPRRAPTGSSIPTRTRSG